MLTKKDLLKYKVQNPSKFEHKYGHLNLDELPDEGFVNVEKAKTELDGTPARPTVPWSDPSNGGRKDPIAPAPKTAELLSVDNAQKTLEGSIVLTNLPVEITNVDATVSDVEVDTILPEELNKGF